MTTTEIQHLSVAEAVRAGFDKRPKRLPSWMFYDETGDKIFQTIMRMPEYYLTACEYEILQTHKATLSTYARADGTPFSLVELGAGDGFKTELLLKHFTDQRLPFTFSPVDVSVSVLMQLEERLRSSVPGLFVHSINKRYQDALNFLSEDEVRKMYLFLGANIGNFIPEDAISFVRLISSSMQEDDQLLMGFDLKKDPRLIQAAYDDPHGITRDFNLNLLVRLNRELGARFQLDEFRHYACYEPATGMTKSYLVSLKDQDIFFEAFETAVHFDRWEIIHTEVSQKYDLTMIRHLAQSSRLAIREVFYDCKHYFCDVLFSKEGLD